MSKKIQEVVDLTLAEDLEFDSPLMPTLEPQGGLGGFTLEMAKAFMPTVLVSFFFGHTV